VQPSWSIYIRWYYLEHFTHIVYTTWIWMQMF